MTPGPWTAPERDLLRWLAPDIGHCIADPDHALHHFSTATHSGGAPGFAYRYTRTALTGQWHETLIARRRPDGTPWMWRRGRTLAEASVTYTRLRRWCETLPAEVRAQAVTWWRTYPEDTRDLPALHRLALAAINAADPEPALFELA